MKLNANSPERKEVTEINGRLEHKRAPQPYQVKATGEDGTLDGYGAVFNVLHDTSNWMLGPDWQDSISPGAFTKSLAEFKKIGVQPLMLFQHVRGNVPGAWRSVSEDKNGLAVSGQVSKNAITPSGVTLYELLKMGALSGLSIGFYVTKCTLDEDTKVRTILEVDLREVSIVDDPGGPTARVTDVKAAGNPHDIQFLEQHLRDAGLSRREAKALLAEGFNALRDAAANDVPTQRDAGQGDDGTSTNSEQKSLAGLIRGLAQSIRPPGQE